jgi:hypothetical protein
MVRRIGAPKLVLNVLIAFGATVLLTRLFLELTGYPRLGGDTLHIAHLLYGGLALAAACLVMLVFASPSAQAIGSILTGIGLGLFFDEVGKFITANNDYFYKPAAPIIYVICLLIALLYYLLKRRSLQPSDGELVVEALEDAESLLEGQQTEQHHRRIDDNLDHIIGNLKDPDHVRLAVALREFTDSEAVRPGQSAWQVLVGRFEQWSLQVFTRYRKFLTIALLTVLGLNNLGWIVVITVVFASPIVAPALARQIEALYVSTGLRQLSPFRLSIDNIDLLLNYVTAALSLYSIILFVTRRVQQGLFWLQLTLILQLCVVNVFTFYAEQFSAAINTLNNLLVLLYVRLYQHQLKQADVQAHLPSARPVNSGMDEAAVTR